MIGTLLPLKVFKMRTPVFCGKDVVVVIEVVDIVVVVVKIVVDAGLVVKAVVGVVVVNDKARGQHILIELKCLIKVTVIKIKNKL